MNQRALRVISHDRVELQMVARWGGGQWGGIGGAVIREEVNFLNLFPAREDRLG